MAKDPNRIAALILHDHGKAPSGAVADVMAGVTGEGGRDGSAGESLLSVLALEAVLVAATGDCLQGEAGQ